LRVVDDMRTARPVMAEEYELLTLELHAGGWIIALADMPWLAPHTIARVAQALDARHCVAPFHQGRRGHPIGFGADYFAGLAALDGDEGARALIDPARLIRLDVGDAGTLRDVDTPADVCGA
ncbi:nucleotidyltransferase family protein, partial [Ralstonia pseudosolanacearum]|uniref:nucleotidyltransferase family protein n=1 Tax=Ralstonia pseudosolanacearum TaxID=1310165 RepID=UPI003CE69559